MSQVWEVIQLETHREMNVRSYADTVSPPVVSKGPASNDFFLLIFSLKYLK